jgi:hypothetical protein
MMKESKIYTSDELSKFIEENKGKVPIYKGCGNKTCLCTGACKEVIGYRDRFPGEESPYDFSKPPFNKSQEDPSREAYENELKRRQDEHLERVRKNTQPYGNRNQGHQQAWRPCMHDQCSSCYGTGMKFDGSPCIHMISCPCPKCSPSYMSTAL